MESQSKIKYSRIEVKAIKPEAAGTNVLTTKAALSGLRIQVPGFTRGY